MKWIALVAALAAVLPIAGWIRQNHAHAPKVWMLVGSLPFVLPAFDELDVAVISWPLWPGYAKGIEVSLLDVLALALYLSLPRVSHPLPFRVAMGFYFVAVALSALQAPMPLAALFYVWQLARAFLIYAVVAKACADDRVPGAVLTGMTAGLALEACVVAYQRFGLGIIQTAGTFSHQNMLAMMAHFAVFPMFALLLVGRQGWAAHVAPLSGMIIAVLTVSRGSLALTAAGLVVVCVLSVLRQWTPRKAAVAVLGTVVAAAFVPLAMSSLQARFEAVPLSAEYDERAAFEEAASLILSEHPLGVGANNYVPVANVGGYMDRAGVAEHSRSRSTSVHNTYWLAAAETGYLGVVAFVMLLLRPMLTAFVCSWQNRWDQRGDMLLGLGCALLVVYIHSYFEWVFFLTVPTTFAITVGLVAGLSQQLGYWRPAMGAAPEARGWREDAV